MNGSVAALVVGAALLAACSNPGRPEEAGSPSTASASPDDLAPSQLTAETVPRPDTPPPCDADIVGVAFVGVTPATPASTVVLSLRNQGGVWCEIDIGGSPSVDPRMEPDVWLEPGEQAELTIELSGGSCDSPDGVPLDINGELQSVPLGDVSFCDWSLVAFAPV